MRKLNRVKLIGFLTMIGLVSSVSIYKSYEKYLGAEIDAAGPSVEMVKIKETIGKLIRLLPGNLWWRSDENQLRFKSDDAIEIILKEPLYSAPPENMVLNQCFEEDSDGDGIPDYWEKVIGSGSPAIGRDPTQQYKGKYSAYILNVFAGEGKLRTSYIPVTPNKKYLLKMAYRGSIGKTHEWAVACIEWYDEDKTKITEVDPPADWKTTTTSWVEKEHEFTVPSGVCYARVGLRNYSSSSTTEGIYYDDIVFSEQRSLEPTQETVAVQQFTSVSGVSVPAETWTNMGNFNIPNEDMEILFLFGQASTSSGSTSILAEWRLYDITDGLYYPSSSGIRSSLWGSGSDIKHCNFIMTIPKNVKGHSMRLEVYTGIAATVDASWNIWGHSPHKHR